MANKNIHEGIFPDQAIIDLGFEDGEEVGFMCNTVKTMYLSCIAPSLYNTTTDTLDGAVSSSNRMVVDTNISKTKIAVGDGVTTSELLVASWLLIDKINPDGDNVKEFSVSEKVFIDDGTTLTFTPHTLPLVTSSTDEGSGNWTASTAQTLERGITLTVGGTSKRAVITGDIEFVNVDSPSFILYFDVEKFLIAS